MLLNCLRGTITRCLGLALTAWLTFLPFVGAAADAPAFRFQTNDVIAFVGGEDVVEMQRDGYLELLLTAALPHHKLRFRNVASEGDTVFEQHRQLNFPPLEKQLERMKATVVIAQFGQAESLQGTNGLGRFIEAYERLINRFGPQKRRILLIGPTPLGKIPGRSGKDLLRLDESLVHYTRAASEMAAKQSNVTAVMSGLTPTRDANVELTRDGLHLNSEGHWSVAWAVFSSLRVQLWDPAGAKLRSGGEVEPVRLEHLRRLIIEKNRLWFDYWRPQNWAFLAGDRTEQPSSRDHRDPKKRWFPEEMEKFVPLIEAKEREIWEAAAKLAKGE